VVVQQGMSGATRYARRYHWRSEGLQSFVEAPHTAIEGRNEGQIINLTDHRATVSRAMQLDLLHDLGPDRIVREVAALENRPVAFDEPMLPHLVLPAHHDVRPRM
jgi:hypothetical protein